MRSNALTLTIIVGLVALALALWDRSPEDLLPLLDPGTETVTYPYAVINDAQSKHYGREGQLSYQFFADTLLYFRSDMGRVSADDYTEMESPELTLFADGRTWRVSARHGRVTEFGEVFTLWDNVRIWQEDAPAGATELSTHRLIILPEAKIVRTDAQVQVNSAEGALEARGMVVNLNTQSIRLLNEVRGVHEPI